jgi:hypothetical protein
VILPFWEWVTSGWCEWLWKTSLAIHQSLSLFFSTYTWLLCVSHDLWWWWMDGWMWRWMNNGCIVATFFEAPLSRWVEMNAGTALSNYEEIGCTRTSIRHIFCRNTTRRHIRTQIASLDWGL